VIFELLIQQENMKRRRIEICSLDFLMFAYERRLEEEELMEEGRMEVCERASYHELRESFNDYLFEIEEL
jgi:hypothetical protein